MSCDPNFSQVSLLLTFDGPNGSTVFTDTSQNALPMTAAGAAAVSTTNPEFGSGCALFDGFASSYISTPVAASGPLDLSTGDFTIEVWARFDMVLFGGVTPILGNYSGALGWDIVLGPPASHSVGFNFASSGGMNNVHGTPNDGLWHFISAVRQGNVFDVWIDGIASGAATTFVGSIGLETPLYIGADPDFAGGGWPGAIDEVRITKGVALYTPGVNYTPPTAPFGASCATPACDPDFSAVSLLLDMEGGFADTGPLGLVLTNSGSVVNTADNPKFGTDSALFNGTNSLQYPVVAAGPFDLSTGDWTIEGWLNNHAGTTGYFLRINDTGFGPGVGAGGLFAQATTGAFSVQLDGDAATATVSSGNVGAAKGQWAHWAIVCHAGVLSAYLEGVSNTTGVQPASSPWTGGTLYIGDIQSGSQFQGQIDELRITKGVARYTANFTPPVLPFGLTCASATVPNVVGETLAQAETDILAASCTVGTVTTAGSGTVPAGDIISQSPIGGTVVSVGAPVDLVESLGLLATVPDLTNTSVAVVAPGLLAAAHLVLGSVTHEASGIIIAGNIIRQSPAPGATVSAGSAVNVVVSSGLPGLTVPDLFGMTQADAIATLLGLGLVPGAIGSAPSQFVPPNEVQAQNPSAGTPVAVGTIVSFVLSTGTPAVGTLFDFEATVISQYANSPVILQLVQNLNQYIDQSQNFANFFNFVWNVDTAVGFGLDIWGKIVGVSRLLQIPNTTDYVGFDNGTRSPPDWQSMGSDQPPYNNPPVGGAMYTGFNATSTYLLGDDAYRQLILAKAFANIAATTAPAINTILQNLYGPGTAWVLNTGPMAISYNLNFKPSAIQLAILEQSGIIPTPPGVSVAIVVPP
jgi:beta-lactam-binding protein with PASTA domain